MPPRARPYYIGHHTPLGNFFTAWALKDAVVVGWYQIVTSQYSSTLYTRLTIIFSSCFSKVTIGFIPRWLAGWTRHRGRTRNCSRACRGVIDVIGVIGVIGVQLRCEKL